MSVLLIVGFSANVSAQNPNWVGVDDPDDSLMDPYEIREALVEIGPSTGLCSSSFWVACGDDGDCPGGETCEYQAVPDYMKLCLQMDGKLPGVIMMDINVDADTATGGSAGMVALFPACAGGGEIKPDQPGTDVALTIVLDEQNTLGCSLEWCNNCKGPGGQCFIKDTPCDPSCGTADCYKGNTTCNPGPSDCYLASVPCDPDPQDPLCDKCFEMPTLCSDQNPCGYAKILGEWYASTLNDAGAGFQMGAPFYSRGRIEMPLPPQGGPSGTDDLLCIKLPWARMLNTLKFNNGAYNADFDFDAAKNAANTTWQLGALEDGDVGGCDYIDPTGGPCLNIVDAVPNTGLAPAVAVMLQDDDYQCEGDFDRDGDVDGTDTTTFLESLGRFSANNPCCNVK